MKCWLFGKDSDAGRDWEQEEKGMTEDEMAGWHHWLDGREFEWTPGDGDGHGGLACCDSWGRKESDTTEQLNWTELRQTFLSASVLDIVTNDKDCILLILLEQLCLIFMPSVPSRCSAPRMQTLREKTEGKANYVGWRRVEVGDPGRKRGVKRKEHKE